MKASRLRMDLLGLAAPGKSMSLQASVELDSENEALQAQLAQTQGPPALTVMAGKAEAPDERQ